MSSLNLLKDEGQVWSIFVHDEMLFYCGHDRGTFIVKNDIKNIFSNSGTWNLLKFR
jgi:hypothetical protein